jgi:hypothetical protein
MSNFSKIINIDYASLYPTRMRDFNNDLLIQLLRKKKIDKIMNNINNRI